VLDLLLADARLHRSQFGDGVEPLLRLDLGRYEQSYLAHRLGLRLTGQSNPSHEKLDEPYLAREREFLSGVLADGERILDVEQAGRGVLKPGILVLTERRLLHLYFRRLLRRMKVLDLSYSRIDAAEVESLSYATELKVSYNRHQRAHHFPILAGRERASALAMTINRARGMRPTAPEPGRVLRSTP
jgi:hypothetical protein